jgi:hypothetical protein
MFFCNAGLFCSSGHFSFALESEVQGGISIAVADLAMFDGAQAEVKLSEQLRLVLFICCIVALMLFCLLK